MNLTGGVSAAIIIARKRAGGIGIPYAQMGVSLFVAGGHWDLPFVLEHESDKMGGNVLFFVALGWVAHKYCNGDCATLWHNAILAKGIGGQVQVIKTGKKTPITVPNRGGGRAV